MEEIKTQEMYSGQDRIKREIQIGKWHVSLNGDMDYDNRYCIEGNSLDEEDWIIHIFEKGWIDFNEFIPAYFQALKNIGKQYVNVQVFY